MGVFFMRTLLLSICKPAIMVIALVELVMTIVLFKKYAKDKKPIALCMALITVGLLIDASVIALGGFIDVTKFALLSRCRFIAHGALIPLLFPICGYSLKANNKVMKVVWVFTAVIMVAGLAEALASVLEVKEMAGVMRYVAGDATPVWAEKISRLLSFGTVIPLMICGVIVWIKQKNPNIFLSGFLMFAFSALGPATGNADLIFFISMFGEALMILFFILYLNKD